MGPDDGGPSTQRLLVTRLVLPIMYRQNSGKIVNTASQLAYKASPGLSHDVAAKAAIVAFTPLALEIGTRNVNANRVAPGATCTALIAEIADDSMTKIRASIPKGRIGEVDDIVRVVRVPRIRRGALLSGPMHQSERRRYSSSK